MVTRFSQLGDLLQEDFLPLWLKAQLLARKDDILRELNEKGEGVFTFSGPSGEELRLEIKSENAAAAA